MELVTIAEASEIAHCTPGAIIHQVKKGRIQKHPMLPHYKRRYYVDLDEVMQTIGKSWMERVRDINGGNQNLVTTKEMGEFLGITPDAIRHYVHKGYVTRHYLPGSTKYYLVDIDEVINHTQGIDERYYGSLESEERSQALREHAKSQMRDSGGRFLKSK